MWNASTKIYELVTFTKISKELVTTLRDTFDVGFMRKVSDPADQDRMYSVDSVSDTSDILIANLNEERHYKVDAYAPPLTPSQILAPLGAVDDDGNPLGSRAWTMDANKMQAVIVAGDANGRPGQRYQHALRLCNNLGFKCNRSKAMYVAMKEYKDVCGDHTVASKWGRTAHEFKQDSYRRGCAFAHRVALEQIAESENKKRRVIFEDDIVSPYETQQHGDPKYMENAARSRGEIMNFLEGTKEADLAYIGHCFNGNCLHAYAVTPEGARKVLGLVDWCQPNRGTKSPEGDFEPIDEILKKHCAADQLLDGDRPNGNEPPQGAKLKCAYAPNIETSAENNAIAWGNGLLRQYHNFHSTHA